MENIKVYQERNVKALIAKFENELTTVHLYTNSYLAYNLRVLATAVDATYLRKVLQELLDSWCNRLPSSGEEGVDINWEGVIERLYMARREFVKRGNSIQPVKAHIIRPLSQERKKWNDWQNDLLKEEEAEIMESSQYRLCLNPVGLENLWCFTTNDYGFSNKIEDEDLSDMRSFLRSMSSPKHAALEEFLMYEIDRIQTLASNLNEVLTKPYKIIGKKEKCEELYLAFYERMQSRFSFKADMQKDEFNEWMEENRDIMTEELLVQKKKEYWDEVRESGFLVGLASRQESFPCMKQFFDGQGLKKVYTGRYIYMRQFRYANWWEKAEKFFIFLSVNSLMDEEIQKLADDKVTTPATGEEAGSVSRQEVIADCIRQLMEEWDDELHEKLVIQYNQWIAIQRILCDFYGFSKEYTEFTKQVEDLHIGTVSYPCKLGSLKKPYDIILLKHFEKWKEYKTDYNPKERAFLLQYNVAVRLLELLEKAGVSKVA